MHRKMRGRRQLLLILSLKEVIKLQILVGLLGIMLLLTIELWANIAGDHVGRRVPVLVLTFNEWKV